VSDQPRGSAWWQASDGKWYPPETHPAYRPAPPPPVTGSPMAGPPPRRGSSCLPWLIVAAVSAALLVIVAAVVIAVAVGRVDEVTRSRVDRETPNADDAATDRTPGATSDAAGAADEVDDVGPCVKPDDETITLEVVNNSSKQSSYIIDVNFLDDSGRRVGDESFFVSYVRPGESTREDLFVFDDSGGASCRVAEVQRLAAESPDDLAEVTCETAGVDPLDDISSVFTATNGSSTISDYLITAAFTRDGVRIGTSFAVIENVPPGQSAPGEGFSTVDGPDLEVTCEVVYVERTASE